MSLFRVVACVLGTALLAVPGDASSDTDLAWVGTLPGFALKDKASGETSYMVNGDAKQAFDALAKSLTERGWRIEPGKSNTVSLVSAQRMTATKGDVEAFFHMKQAAIITKLIVTTRTVAPAPAPAAAAKPAPAAASSTKAQPAALPPLEFYDNGIRGSYRCEGRRVSVNGNACELTLEGACDSLSVTGNGNRVRVLAQIGSISVLGNQNSVAWSKAGNPKPPRVSNLGSGSSVNAE